MTPLQWLTLSVQIVTSIATGGLAWTVVWMARLYGARFERLERWVGALRRAAPAGTCLECGLQAPMQLGKGHDLGCVFYVSPEREPCARCGTYVESADGMHWCGRIVSKEEAAELFPDVRHLS